MQTDDTQAEYKTRSRTIFRVEKNADNPFVMIDRRPIENPKLSWKAKGILAYLLSRPDNWIVRFRDLVNRSPDGAHTVRAALKELKALGHVKVSTIREGGRVKQWTYTVYESPECDFQQVEKQQVENRTLNDTDLTDTDSKDIKEGASATPKPPKANDFPSNVLYREVTEKYPAKASWHTVLQNVFAISKRLGREPVKEDLLPFYEAWVNNGWNQYSVNWMDYAVKGELPKLNGAKHATPTNRQPNAAIDLEQLERDRATAERIKARRAAQQAARV